MRTRRIGPVKSAEGVSEWQVFDDRSRVTLRLAGHDGKLMAGCLQLPDHRFDTGIHRVLAPTDGVEAIVVVLDCLFDAVVIVIEQRREAVPQRRTDPVAHLGRRGHAQLCQGVPYTAENAELRIDQRAVEVEQTEHQ